MKTEANEINSAEHRCHSTIPECFRKPLMKVAYKLLSRDKATFEELTPNEQQSWNSFETDQIFLFKLENVLYKEHWDLNQNVCQYSKKNYLFIYLSRIVQTSSDSSQGYHFKQGGQ